MITTLKTSLNFEPRLQVAGDAVASTGSAEGFRPVLGVLSFVPYLPAKLRYVGRFDQAPTQGSVTVEILAAGTVLASAVVGSVAGADVFSGSIDVPLAGVGGSDPLDVQLKGTGATDAGRVCSFSAALDIEQPIAASGC